MGALVKTNTSITVQYELYYRRVRPSRDVAHLAFYYFKGNAVLGKARQGQITQHPAAQDK